LIGIPSSATVLRTAAAPSAKVAGAPVAIATCRARTSAASLSLTSTVCSTICASGGLVTRAISLPAGSAALGSGTPTTSMPAFARAAAKTVAATWAGSSTRPVPSRGRPSSTQRDWIGATTSSGMYDGGQCGLTSGPVNSVASYPTRIRVVPLARS
jgi:hypothetical protein